MFNVSDIIHGATGLRCQHAQTPAPVHYSPRQPLETVRREFNGAHGSKSFLYVVICRIAAAKTFSTDLP